MLLSLSPNHSSHFVGIDAGYEVVSAIGQRSAPFLMSILCLTALSKSCAAVHGSAFVRNGFIATFMPRGGKCVR